MQTNQQNEIKHRLFKRLRKWFASLFRLDSEKNKGQDPKIITSPRISQLYETMEKESEYINNQLIVPELEKEFVQSRKYMIQAGFIDGVNGISQERQRVIEGVAENRSQQLYDFSATILTSKLAKLKTNLEAQQDIKERFEVNDRQQHSYYKYLQFLYRYHPRSFSLLLFLLYTVTFLILLLADIPLAVLLIQNGFDRPVGEFPLEKLFEAGQFWAVISSNWDILLTALGICLSTVYIKIFYDEFIGVSYGHRTFSEKKFAEMYAGSQKVTDFELSKEEKEQIDGDHKRSRIWKISICVFTIATIIILGFFRQEAWDVLKGKNMVSDTVLFLTFTAITLLFPVISGVCLSLALTNLQNFTRILWARWECNSAHRKYNDALKQLILLEEEHKGLKKALEKWDNFDERVKKYASILISFYQQGYNIGMSEPDYFIKELDFFNKMVYFREKAAARKINSTIIKLSV